MSTQGVSQAQFFDQYLGNIKLNQEAIDWAGNDLSYLEVVRFVAAAVEFPSVPPSSPSLPPVAPSPTLRCCLPTLPTLQNTFDNQLAVAVQNADLLQVDALVAIQCAPSTASENKGYKILYSSTDNFASYVDIAHVSLSREGSLLDRAISACPKVDGASSCTLPGLPRPFDASFFAALPIYRRHQGGRPADGVPRCDVDLPQWLPQVHCRQRLCHAARPWCTLMTWGGINDPSRVDPLCPWRLSAVEVVPVAQATQALSLAGSPL